MSYLYRLTHFHLISGLTEPTGLCDAGYVCVSTSVTAQPSGDATGHVCEAGDYCPAGSGQGTACPAGTFSNTPGLTETAQCTPCTAGTYCSITGMSYT